MNSVQDIIRLKFSTLSPERKVEIKKLGRPLPKLSNLVKKSIKGQKEYNRHFNSDLYQKYNWLCGCEISNALFCFPCVCFGGDLSWSKTGMTDLVHILAKINKHENSHRHLHNDANFKLLGTIDIKSQIDTGYKLRTKRHNERVSKNRDVLEKILNCVKFCGNYELPLRGYNEKVSSENQGVFRGLINLCSDLYPNLREHMEKSVVFNGTSKTIQNELLDSILCVARTQILNEINNSDYLSIIVDETSDISNKFQLALIFRYEINGKPVERFWGYFYPNGHNEDSFTQTIFKEIDPILEKTPEKLIAQSYDGAAVISGQQSGVNARIKEKYPYAYFIHCYAHQLNLILTQASSQNKQVKIFFSNLSEIPVFFSNSPQRVAVLDDIVGSPLPRAVQTRWNFNIRTVNTVYDNRGALIECMEKIIDSSIQSSTINQATGLKRLLTDMNFVFWLTVFHKIMPHVDCLHNVVQSNTDPVQIQKSVISFKKEISNIRDSMTDFCQNFSGKTDFKSIPKKRRIDDTNYSRKLAALEVCDIIITHVERRFVFTKHLSAAQLFQNEKYAMYSNKFPRTAFNTTVECYPFCNQDRLRTELEVLYSRDDFCNLSGIISTLNYIINNNMKDTFKEVTKLLKLLVCTPVITSEAERSFSTLKRIKTCLRSIMCEDRLNALTMLSVESYMINENIDFNKNVIDNFCNVKEKRMDFVYKVCA